MSNAWRKWLPISLLTSLVAALTFWIAPADAAKPAPPPPPTLPQYSITFLGTLGYNAPTDIDRSMVRGMNRYGDVVGDSSGPDHTQGYAFLYTDEDGMIDLTELFVDEGLLDPYDFDTDSGWFAIGASDINDHGQIVGTMYVRDHGVNVRRTQYRYSPSTIDSQGNPVPSDLEVVDGLPGASTLPGLLFSWITRAINNDGEVTGVAQTADNQQVAVVWTPSGNLVQVGVFNGQRTVGMDINDDGEICGGAGTTGSGYAASWLTAGCRAWRTTPSGAFQNLGTLFNAGKFSNATSQAVCINHFGQVAGDSWNGKTLAETYAFRYTDGAGMKQLSTTLSYSRDINSFGDVVGVAWYYSPTKWYLSLYTDKVGFKDLESYVSNLPAGVSLVHATAQTPLPGYFKINDAGQICGDARVPGTVYPQAYRLTPMTPVPH